MAKLVIAFGLLGYMSVIKTKLSLPNNDISILKVDKKISASSLESVFDSYHFDCLPTFAYSC